MSRSPSITDPPYTFLITPDNDNDLERPINAIAFAGAGSLTITTPDGQVVTIPSGALASGVQHVLRATRVHATGTTATDLVGFTHLEA